MKKRLFISVVLLASILGALPLCAQESCYAQYLREHNMRVLTAEDADDSYDELKKAVLAWQMYGSEASLPFAPKEEPIAPKLQDTTCVIVHLALVDSTWYMWLSVDPLADKYPNVTPYLYCNGNPIMLVDPDGKDWYEAEDGSIKWTDYKSQQAMDQAKLAGRYLGEAVISFNGYYDEALGKGNNLWGEGAKLATATVYGPRGSNDIATYDAFTMSSNYNEYGAIKNGDYSLNYVEATGPMGTHWTINNRGAVDCINDYNTAWYKHKETNPYSATQKNRTYVHRCNLNGDMLPLGKDGQYHPLSTGCLIIAPSRNGKPGWNEFNNQLKGIKKAFLRLTRQ